MTTLEILAPYLPYDIEVETPSGRMKVFAMDKWSISATYPKRDNTGFELGYNEISPVLFGFADLCTPLADGTVPYEELKKMTDYGWRMSHPQYKGCRIENDCVIERWVSSHGDKYDRGGSLKSHIWGEKMTLKAADYLRSKQFAVGLSADQFIRKTA